MSLLNSIRGRSYLYLKFRGEGMLEAEKIFEAIIVGNILNFVEDKYLQLEEWQIPAWIKSKKIMLGYIISARNQK